MKNINSLTQNNLILPTIQEKMSCINILFLLLFFSFSFFLFFSLFIFFIKFFFGFFSCFFYFLEEEIKKKNIILYNLQFNNPNITNMPTKEIPKLPFLQVLQQNSTTWLKVRKCVLAKGLIRGLQQKDIRLKWASKG